MYYLSCIYLVLVFILGLAANTTVAIIFYQSKKASLGVLSFVPDKAIGPPTFLKSRENPDSDHPRLMEPSQKGWEMLQIVKLGIAITSR